jgi:hypothetical protein
MKALFTLKSALNQGSLAALAALVTIAPLIYPAAMARAMDLQASGQSTALVFEIKNPETVKIISSLQYLTIVQNDPLVDKLTAYLQSYGSPLDVYAADIVQQPRWEDALAISFVESNMGKFCYNNNCSGIGVKPGHPSWRKYPDKLAWFKDLSVLLQKPIYAEKYNTFRKMKGIYVNPGSERWVNGAEKIKGELLALENEADQERIAMTQDYQLALASAK